MSTSLRNAFFGALDYAAYPLGMLVIAPVMLRHLGPAQYGMWVLANSAVNLGGIVASGFGDANIYSVACLRSSGERQAVVRTVQAIFGIHLALGVALAAAGFASARYLSHHAALGDDHLASIGNSACLWASMMILARALETVCVSTLRAFERYGAAIQVGVSSRLATLALSVLLCVRGGNVAQLMAWSCGISVLALVAQWHQMLAQLGARSITPTWSPRTAGPLLRFGLFSWMIAVSGALFFQADRFLVGASVGAATLAGYALCVQVTQPMYGFSAAALHFLLPQIARQLRAGDDFAANRTLLRAITANVVGAFACAIVLHIFGPQLMQHWIGYGADLQGASLIRVLAWSFALLAVSVPAYYSMLALGRVATVALFQLTGGAAALIAMGYAITANDIHAVASARLIYGGCAVLLYVPLVKALRRQPSFSGNKIRTTALCEDV